LFGDSHVIANNHVPLNILIEPRIYIEGSNNQV
jgi:hypothetical protein